MRTVAVDLDGVIHAYSKGWSDGSIYDPPMKGAIETLHYLLSFGYAVYVHTTRSPRQTVRWLRQFPPFDYSGEPSPYSVAKVPFWKKFWDVPYVLGVSKRKLPAIAYIDDRAYRFVPEDREVAGDFTLHGWKDVRRVFLPISNESPHDLPEWNNPRIHVDYD